MDNSTWLSIGHTLLDTTTYVVYNWEFWRGRSRPNRVAWGLWTYLAALNAASYLIVSSDLIKTLLAFENFAMCAVTFFAVLFRGTTKPINTWEKTTLIISLIAGTAWFWKKDAFYGNAILQAATTISFLPLFADLRKDPQAERPFPWFMWSAIYTSLLIVVILRWSGDWKVLVYPINYVILHVAVFVLTLRRVTTPTPQPNST